MVNGSIGVSGSTFDAFVSSQRSHNENADWAAKIQEKYWRARQKFLSKIERNEDSSIVLSDAKLDSKLGIYKSIDRSCSRLTNILESYQNSLFMFSNEENALGILLKECGKHDQTKAGKIMSMTGKSLTQSSHQRIRLYMPLMRLYQEMETFHSRAVEDTSDTVDKLESRRSQYRASLLWMKDISEKLDPDIYRQLDKFRRVQNKVREEKRAFDGMQMDVVQKIDLLMASRCNLMNQILAPYQAILLETFEKNYNNFKSIEELIKSEDIYEYEFKTLKQLNPLKISSDSPVHQHQPHQEEEEGTSSGHEGGDAACASSDSKPKVIEEDLLLGTDDRGEQGDANNYAGENKNSNLVDFFGDDLEAPESKGQQTKEIDLLDSLFGDCHDHNQDQGKPTNQEQLGEGSSLRQRKPTKHDEFKAMRSNLDANLFDIEGDEDRQIASLLGPSMKSQSGTNLKQLHHSSQPVLMDDDFFSKWARDADIDLSNNVQQDDSKVDSSDNNNNDKGGGGQPGENLMDIEPVRDTAGTSKKDISRFYA